jgi:CBS domain-containing membrane protein
LAREPSLGIDWATTGSGSRDDAPVARIAVRYAEGYTRDGAPTLTRDCPTAQALERAVSLLRDDLDAALEEARARFEGAARRAAPAAPAPAGEQPPATRPRLESDLRVADVMTREVRTLRRNDPVSVADELMRVGRFRHAVVVDEEGEVVGLLSQRDIMLNALAWHLGQGRKAHEQLLATALAKDLMHANVVTIEPDAPIGEAARRLVEHRIGCLPVVDASGLVGIVTESDFLGLVSR